MIECNRKRKGKFVMFGFASADPEKLSEAARERYRAVYCGICRAMGQGRNSVCRMALTYDLVLPALILSDVTDTPFVESEICCGVHPFKKHKACTNVFTDFAADMNVLLAFYNFVDDLNDDGGIVSRVEAALFWNAADELKRKYGALADTLIRCLREIAAAEKRDERCADIPAAAFGQILGSIFAWFDLPCKDALFNFGFALGKAVYFMDAAVDVKADLKKKQYNPLISISMAERRSILELQMAECMRMYSLLPLKRENEIVENILLSGIWARYDMRYGAKKKNGEGGRGNDHRSL